MGFFLSHISMLLDQGHTVDLACNIKKPINPKLLERGCRVFNIKFQRFPLKKENYFAYRHLKNLIQDEKYDLVHTHTPIASVALRLACRNMKNVKVIYTAHGFHFFAGAPFKNWLIYYPIEKFLSRYTDVLITINKEDYNRANKSFKTARVKYIPGVGLDTEKFSQVLVDKIKKRSEIGVPEDAFVVLSVGELNSNKNHETIIKAISILNNPNIYYIICGRGPLENYLRNVAIKLQVDKQIKLLGFRRDIAEICKISDVFAFPSKREGLGLAALEAMSCGLPIVTSNTHGILDYSINGITGYVCKPTDADGFAKIISRLAINYEERLQMGLYNAQAVKVFDLENVMERMQEIYSEL